jgi:uncharacterized membrane protein YdjX (TVP38/TMEM64 family)
MQALLGTTLLSLWAFGRTIPSASNDNHYYSDFTCLSERNFLKFIVFTFAGSLIWSISLTLVGYTFGKTTQEWIESSSYIFNYIAIIIIVGIFGYIVYRFVKSR